MINFIGNAINSLVKINPLDQYHSAKNQDKKISYIRLLTYWSQLVQETIFAWIFEVSNYFFELMHEALCLNRKCFAGFTGNFEPNSFSLFYLR